MIEKLIEGFDTTRFQIDLIEWYNKYKRDLPWRKDQDPYKIWVSEIMLQQTQVDTVIPYFQRFIEQFPTPKALAEADEQDVLKAWEGLGYYSRARNLHTAVKDVVIRYNGRVPNDGKQLLTLKGIGPYTRGAIMSIAFNEPYPAVDGNVMRVFSRVLKIEDDIAQAKTRRLFEKVVGKIISKENPSAFNQGIMDLGATICTPKSPQCLLCPVQSHCRAYAEGIEQWLPVKSKAKKKKRISYISLLIQDEHGQIMIEKRPNEGLLANLWQFPMIPIKEVCLKHLPKYVYEKYGIHIRLENKQGELRHVFTHLIWDIEIFQAKTTDKVENDRLKQVSQEALADYPFPVPHQKMMQYI
ncbi:A/G-specific adenine glycosylase [Cerasibacillus quisquiliarum]|uniref:Adenine DNA glycosylase n=1 Tax=Cerasibacillus quisquiliarum TaxID=227865 RepID=A0A511V1T8_9BACI|nr:A/G-specific adenine glycosylase [Cerasibacillus quisquiliarum]MBB5146614.1 A/G-specific adenine glycosylase [Cerasibacillus quisquiliarum]GEN31312.1 adenine DNA glycosylase [Cerasibacillus quisquiliarum]